MNWDTLTEMPKQATPPSCGVARLISEAPTPGHAALITQMLSRRALRKNSGSGYTDSELAAHWSANGYPISPATINRHRNGTCPCARKELAA